MPDGFVKTALGRIHYLHAGRGPALLLLHGNGSSAYQYEEVMAPLAERRHVYAWDMPGHGDSDPLPRHYTIGDYADAAIAFMDALGIDRASVLGAGIGGTIALDLGARHAARVERLVAVETSSCSDSVWAQRWLTVEENFGIPTQTEAQVAAHLRAVTPARLTRWNIDRNKAGAKTMVGVMWAIRAYDLDPVLPQVKARALLVFGDKGAPVAGAPLFEQNMANADVTVLKGCGHFPMLDDPSAFIGAVSRFLDG